MSVSLLDADPPIWRLLEVRSSTTLAELSAVIQTAFGWSGEHQHVFTTPHGLVADPGADLPAADERTVTLAEAMTHGHLQYRYDLGDAWDHLVRLEKVTPSDPRLRYPRCTDGARAAPPEHVAGGVHGYAALLSVLPHPDHPDHPHLTEYLDADFDPNHFSATAIDAELRD
nr:plasmid pRiA4b ORF-3 family protein [Actinokineospora spheciospongiae]